MARPVIGISTYREPASFRNWEQVPAHVLPAAYADAVSAGGGTPVLLPPYGPADDIPAVVRRLDALVIAGGSDVNPSRYGAAPHAATGAWRDDRDVSELALLDAAGDLELPVLGVCRGMQVMAVHAGGRLHQHVPDVVGDHRHSPGPQIYGPMDVGTVDGSRLAGILGVEVKVACHHHQAVAFYPGFDAVATASDGLVEAIEARGSRFYVGVQWHPETDTDRRLFAALADAAS